MKERLKVLAIFIPKQLAAEGSVKNLNNNITTISNWIGIDYFDLPCQNSSEDNNNATAINLSCQISSKATRKPQQSQLPLELTWIRLGLLICGLCQIFGIFGFQCIWPDYWIVGLGLISRHLGPHRVTLLCHFITEAGSARSLIDPGYIFTCHSADLPLDYCDPNNIDYRFSINKVSSFHLL